MIITKIGVKRQIVFLSIKYYFLFKQLAATTLEASLGNYCGRYPPSDQLRTSTGHRRRLVVKENHIGSAVRYRQKSVLVYIIGGCTTVFVNMMRTCLIIHTNIRNFKTIQYTYLWGIGSLSLNIPEREQPNLNKKASAVVIKIFKFAAQPKSQSRFII